MKTITPEVNAQNIDGKLAPSSDLFAGFSTDVKPQVNVANGSVFIEMDTSKIYFFDLANVTWREWGGA